MEATGIGKIKKNLDFSYIITKIISIAKTFSNFTLGKSHLFRHLMNKMRFQGLAIEPSAFLNIEGGLAYEEHCVVNVGANIIVRPESNLTLGKQVYIGRYVEIGPTHHIKIGDHSSLQDRCILLGDIEIGRYCLFSMNVYVSSGKHYFDKEPHQLICDQDEIYNTNFTENQQKNKVIIEDDCWIGINVVIMRGVRIGKGSIIGANAVVTKDIPPYSVVVGAPATVVKKRLEFIPPIEIVYNNSKDFPYFYSGFEISNKERQQELAKEGLLTKTNFQIALNTLQYSKVTLIVKSSKGEHTLTYNGKVQVVSNKFSEIVFDLSSSKENILDFYNKSNCVGSKLIVQRAWVE